MWKLGLKDAFQWFRALGGNIGEILLFAIQIPIFIVLLQLLTFQAVEHCAKIIIFGARQT